MTTAQASVLWVYALVVAIWPIRWLVLEIVLRRQRTLTPGSPRYDQAEPPLVSAILPAKDEEANLADCLSSVSRQTYPNLEILVVNDRSTDRTGEIARSIAEGDARIQILTIDHLPAGWTGKTHALDRAVGSARGRWLLFVDADTVHEPESLAVMMEFARVEQAALVSLLPELRCETFWESVVQPMGAITLDAIVPTPRRAQQAIGAGLCKRPVHPDRARGLRGCRRSPGGQQPVRRRHRDRRPREGFGIVDSCCPGAGAGHVSNVFIDWTAREGLEPYFLRCPGRSPWRLVGKLLDPMVFCQTGHAALLASLVMLSTGSNRAFAAWLAALSALHHVLMFGVFRRVYNVSVPRSRFVCFYPLANLVVVWILARSLRMCLTGNVTWRGTNYGAAGSSARPAASTSITPIDQTRAPSDRRTLRENAGSSENLP